MASPKAETQTSEALPRCIANLGVTGNQSTIESLPNGTDYCGD
jgi:hypothetical protein